MDNAFGDLFSRHYNAVYASLGDEEIIYSACEQHEGPVLDLGCASGRVLNIFANKGYSATGVDRDLRVLESARVHLKEKIAVNQVNLIRADLEDLPSELWGRFKITLLWTNTLPMTRSRESRITILRNAKKTLLPNGILMLFNASDYPIAGDRPKVTIDTDAGPLTFWSRVSEDWQKRTRVFTYHLQNLVSTETNTFSTSILSLSETLEEAAEAGLVPVVMYGDLARNSCQPDSPFHIVHFRSQR